MTHAALPVEGGASVVGAEVDASRRAITTARDAQPLHHVGPQGPEVGSNPPSQAHAPITRAERAASSSETGNTAIDGKLKAYRNAWSRQERRQCLQDLRKEIRSLDPAGRASAVKEMEAISKRHLWGALGLPEHGELLANSRMENLIAPWAAWLRPAPKVISWAAIGSCASAILYIGLRPVVAPGNNPPGPYTVATTLLAAWGLYKVQTAAIGDGRSGLWALPGNAKQAAHRNLMSTPPRDAANEDKTPEITDMMHGMVELIPPDRRDARRDCVAMLSWLTVKVPELRVAMADFAVSGDAKTLDHALAKVDRLHFNADDRAGLQALDPQLRHAQQCFKNRQELSGRAFEKVRKDWASTRPDKTGPELNHSDEFHADVVKELNGHQPFPYNYNDYEINKGVHEGVHEGLLADSAGRKPSQIIRSSLLEVRRSEPVARSIPDPAVDSRLDDLIAQHRGVHVRLAQTRERA